MKRLKFDSLLYIIIVSLLLLFAISARAQKVESQTPETQPSSGILTLEKFVVAAGGSETENASLKLDGTAGQPVAGSSSTGGTFALYTGFWTPETFAPTAAAVVAGGRIKTADGRGIRNVRVSITFPNGETRTTLSNAFGYYRFTEIPAGETYIFSVSAKRYTFAAGTQVRNVAEDTQDIDFIGEVSVLISN